MDGDHKDWTKEVSQWLEENDSPPLPRRLWETHLPEEPSYRGHFRRYDAVAPDEEILKEHPATAVRQRAREWSERYGWTLDLWRCIVARYEDLWTPEFIIGICVFCYGLSMVVIVWTFGFIALSNPVSRRRLPTIEEIMRMPPQEEEGSPTLTDEHTYPKD